MIRQLVILAASLLLLVMFVPIAQPPPQADQVQIANEQTLVQNQWAAISFVDRQLSLAHNAGVAQQADRTVNQVTPTIWSRTGQFSLLPPFATLVYDHAAGVLGVNAGVVLRC